MCLKDSFSELLRLMGPAANFGLTANAKPSACMHGVFPC